MSFIMFEIAENRFSIRLPSDEHDVPDEMALEYETPIGEVIDEKHYVVLIDPIVDHIGKLIAMCSTEEHMKQVCFNYFRNEMNGELKKFNLVAVKIGYERVLWSAVINGQTYYLDDEQQMDNMMNTNSLNRTQVTLNGYCEDILNCCLSSPGSSVEILSTVLFRGENNSIDSYELRHTCVLSAQEDVQE